MHAHTYSTVVTAPTCGKIGYTTFTCSECSNSYSDHIIPTLPHSHTKIVTDPTCEDDGYTTYTCPACGDVYTGDIIPALGHSFTNYVLNSDNTITAKCDNCDATDTKSIPVADVFAYAESALPFFISFDGYQVRTTAYPGLRARFTANFDAEIDGITLKEMGTILAVAQDGRTMNDLTLSKNDSGLYVPMGTQIMKVTASESNLFAVSGDASKHFACTLTFPTEGTQTKNSYTSEVFFRGYAVFLVYGYEVVCYVDMTSDTFGDTVSMYELSSHEAFADYETSKKVIEICAANVEQDYDIEFDFSDLFAK